MRWTIIVLLLVLLFAVQTVSAQDSAGCCCNDLGRAQKSSVLASSDCDTEAGFTFQVPADDFFLGRSITNICSDFCGVAVGGVVVAPDAGCGSPELLPPPETIRVSPLKGEARLRISWDQQCEQFVNSIKISRCEGLDCSGFKEIVTIPGGNSFLDPNDLEFGKVYTYQLETEFTVGKSEKVTESGGPGDIECKGIKDRRTFCVSPLFYGNFRDYFQTFGYKDNRAGDFAAQNFNQTIMDIFLNRFNKGLSCDDLNKVFTKKTCPDDKGDLCIVDRTSSIGARCAASTDCQLLSPQNFGLAFTEETCEGGFQQKNFCFLDRSKSIADQCFNCVQGMSCYDYRTQRSCVKDNCGAGNCEWRDVFPEIGIGVCVDTRFDNCRLCSSKGTSGLDNLEAYNEIFDQCTQAKADRLSTDESVCFFDARTGAAAGCKDVDCTAFSEEQCGSPGGGIRLDGNNNLIARSKDSCDLGVCQFSANAGCAKNADGESIEGDFRDCADFDGKNKEKCERDRFPPETQVIAQRTAKGVVDEIRIVRRDKEEDAALPSKASSKDNPTFFCVGGGCTDFQEYTQDKLFVDNTFLQKIGEGSRPEIFAILKEGDNTIQFFSQDKHKNKEIVKTLSFRACAACQGPKILNTSVSNSRIREEISYTRDAIPRISVFFNKEVIIVSSEIKRGDLTFAANPSPQGTVVVFSPARALDDGEYELVVDVTDTSGVAIEDPFTVEFVVDTTPPIVQILVENNATPGVIVRKSSAQISLNISEEVDILLATITSKNFSRFVTRDVVMNVTDQFKGGSGGLLTISISLPEGENIITVEVEDFAGHKTSPQPHPFRIFTGPPKIRLVSPSFEVAADFVFPIEIETQNPVDCRFWFNTNKPPIPHPEDFNAMEQFDLSGFTNHIKNDVDRIKEEHVKFPLTVRCQDDLGSESTELYDISVDTSPPLIVSVFAQPDPVIQQPFITTLKIQTNEDTFCKASKTASTFGAMEKTFPGFEEVGATVHELDVEEQEIKVITYNVACINLAELGPVMDEISFEVMEGAPFTITQNTPRYIKEFEFNLAVATNKDASCYYSTSKDRAGDKLGENEGLSRIHITPVTVTSEGTYTYYIRCSTGGETVIGGGVEIAQADVNVTIDTTPPVMVDVNDDSPLFADKEISYFQDHIRAKWLGQDEQSGVPKYLYSVRDSIAGGTVVSEQPSDKEDYFVDIYFDVQDKAKYVVDVKAVNGVGDPSSVLSSDGVSIDFSREPIHCVNGIFEPELGEIDTDCSGECYKCKANQKCESSQDCVSDFCEQGVCQEALCDDGKKNGRETDIDCGGQCGDCADGKKCLVDRDCGTRYCSPGGICEKAPPCANKRLDGSETDIDCGGACPKKCGPGKHCNTDSDCGPGVKCFQEADSGVGKCFGEDDLPKYLQKEQDTDGDGLPDWYEKKYGIEDPEEDTDGDGLSNREEYQYFLQTGREISPINADTDGDGTSDFDEIRLGYNPVDSADYPQSDWWKFLAVLVGLIGFGIVGYYGYLQYQEFLETQKRQPNIKKKKKEEPVKIDHERRITEKAQKIKKMFTKKKRDFMDISDIGKTKRVQTLKKAKHKEEVFSQLSDVRKGKRVTKKPRRAVISGLRKLKTEQPRFDIVLDRKKQAFGKLSLLTKMKGMTADEKKKVAQKLRLLSRSKEDPQARKKLLSDLKITAGYYKKNKGDLAEKADEWYDLGKAKQVQKKRKGKNGEKEGK